MELGKDGESWRIGSAQDVAWVTSSTSSGPTIRSAIPAGFAAYATLVEHTSDLGQANDEDAVVAAVLEHLSAGSGRHDWWLGFLDTGSHDVVFPEAPRISMYAGWQYVFVKAGPRQAASWRPDFAEPTLPDVIFPEDHSWLFSTLWDDTWSCLGGPTKLIRDLEADQRLVARKVSLDQDMTPPGHTMY